MAALAARVAVLEARLPRLRDDDDLALLEAFVASVDRLEGATGRRLSTFNAVAVILHARHDPELADALEANDCDSARSVGRWLARVAGRPVAGVSVVRLDGDRRGSTWGLCAVSEV